MTQTERDPQTLEKKPPTFSGGSQCYSEDVREPGRLVQCIVIPYVATNSSQLNKGIKQQQHPEQLPFAFG